MSLTSPGTFRGVLVLVLAALSPSAAGQTLALPEFDGSRLTVVGVENIYELLRAEIARVESDSSQSYYLVIIPRRDASLAQGTAYIDRLQEKWNADAARKGLKFDRDRSLLIVLATEERKLFVLPGRLLQQQYGLREQTIHRELVEPHFIPHAKANNTVAGLKSLIGATESWLQAKDAEVARQQELALSRQQAVKRNLEDTLRANKVLHQEAAALLSAMQETSPALRELADWASRAEAEFERIETLAPNPQQALDAAQAFQRGYQQALDAVRKHTAMQVQSEAELKQLESLANSIDAQLLSQQAAGLLVAHSRSRLETIFNELAAARNTNASDPVQARQLAVELTGRLRILQDEIAKLPRLAKDLQQKSQSVQALQQQAETALQQAQASGAEVAAFSSQLKSLDDARQKLQQAENGDYSGAIAGLASLESKLQFQQRQLDAAREHHLYVTRTLPLAVTGILVAIAAAIVVWRVASFRITRRNVEQQLAAFRQQTVQLMERLDALKKQHQLLPFADEDFVEPMTGATLALYQEIEQMHGRLRATWLEMMDLRTKVDGLIGVDRWLATKRLREARRLLDGAKSVDFETLYQQCTQRLEKLSQAHEQAAKLATAAEASADALTRKLQLIEAMQLDTATFEAERGSAAALAEQAGQNLRNDPIGAGQMLDQVAAARTMLLSRADRVVHLAEEAKKQTARLAVVAELAVEKRARGFLLIEPEGNPDPLLQQGQQAHQATISALNRAAIDDAEQQLKHGLALADQAELAIERQVAAKADCDRELPARTTEADRLHRMAQQATAASEQLAREFAVETWQEVASHGDQAKTLLATSDEHLAKAKAAAGGNRQHFFQAVALLQQVGNGQQQASNLLAAVERRLQELRELRERCHSRRAEIRQQAHSVREFIQRHEAIVRGAPRSQAAALEDEERRLAATMELPRANWPAIWQTLEQVATGYAAALKHANDDLQAHQQVQRRIDEVRRQAAKVDDLLHSQTADRPRANQAFRTAASRLESLGRESAQPQADWQRLLVQLNEVSTDLENADRWAQEDIRLAQQAWAAIADAQRRIQQAQSYFSMGVSANVSGLESQLADMRRQLEAQAYEQVIHHAGQLEQAARDAYDAAVRESERKQQRMEEERRRQAAAQAAATAAALAAQAAAAAANQARASGASQASTSGGSPRPAPIPSSPPPASSGASSSTWSSGASESSW